MSLASGKFFLPISANAVYDSVLPPRALFDKRECGPIFVYMEQDPSPQDRSPKPAVAKRSVNACPAWPHGKRSSAQQPGIARRSHVNYAFRRKRQQQRHST